MRLGWLLAAILAAGCLDGTSPAGTRTVEIPSAADGSAVLTGLVVDDESRPLEGATVRLVGQDRSAQADASGTFAIGGLVPGEHIAIAEHVGHLKREVGLRLPAGVVTRVDFLLEPVGSGAAHIDAGHTWRGHSGLSAQGFTMGGNALPEMMRSEMRHHLKLRSGWETLLFEVAWTPNWEHSDRLNFTVWLPRERDSDGGYPYSSDLRPQEGTSPLKWRLDADEWVRMRAERPGLYPLESIKESEPIHVPYQLATRGDPLDVQVDQWFDVHATIAYGQPLPPEYTRLA